MTPIQTERGVQQVAINTKVLAKIWAARKESGLDIGLLPTNPAVDTVRTGA
jgi:hypothetical protein